jgi:hypothetical protein
MFVMVLYNSQLFNVCDDYGGNLLLGAEGMRRRKADGASFPVIMLSAGPLHRHSLCEQLSHFFLHSRTWDQVIFVFLRGVFLNFENTVFLLYFTTSSAAF